MNHNGPLPTFGRTRKMRRTLSNALLLLPLAVALGATPARGQVGLTVQWLYAAESVLLSDFDPFSPGSQPDLIGINILNGAPGAQNIVLELRARMVSPRNVFIFEGETDVFALTGSSLRLTNRDLSTRNLFYLIEDFEFGDEAEDMNERLRQTGRFPAGQYEFSVRVCPNSPCGAGNQLAQQTVLRDFVNPTRVELLGPGRPYGDVPPVVTSPSPRFLWTTDTGGLASGLGTYRIRVARVDNASSAEEAIQAFAVWESEVNTTSAVYPGSAQAVPLVAGATYAWQVVREVQTSGGRQPLESPIFWFRMSGGGTQAGSGGEESVPRQIQQLADQLGLGPQLDGFEPRGPVLVDGRPASPDALQELLRRIIAGEATVLSITVR